MKKTVLDIISEQHKDGISIDAMQFAVEKIIRFNRSGDWETYDGLQSLYDKKLIEYLESRSKQEVISLCMDFLSSEGWGVKWQWLTDFPLHISLEEFKSELKNLPSDYWYDFALCLSEAKKIRGENV